MKVTPDLLAWRKTTGADRFDEVWEGVIHVVAAPNREHQDLEGALEAYLRQHWARASGGKVYHQINVAPPGGWPRNYRIPDLVLLTAQTRVVDRNEFFEGPPCVVVEIRSPDDETAEKLPFYAALGVPEVWVIERDSKLPTVYLRQDGDYLPQTTAGGWVASVATPLQMTAAHGKLGVRLGASEAALEWLP